MISRHWRGLAHPNQAQAYVQHLRTKTIPAVKRISGFVDASILRRKIGAGVEFLVVTRWSSMDAIAKFAGPDVEAAVVPAEVEPMMIECDRRARHYEVVE